MPTNIKNQKEEQRAALLRAHGLPRTTRAVVVSYIQDPRIQAALVLACDSLGIALLTEQHENILAGADAWVTDELTDEIPVMTLTKNIVVPIVPVGDKRFTDFNPMKFEGNAFLFEKEDEYHILAALVRYLENVRYPGDKRTLLKNIHESSL